MCNDTVLGIKPDTIYEANPATLRQWARNIHETYPYEQAYGQFIRVIIHDDEPTKHEGEVWMVDTYHLDLLSWSFGTTTQSAIDQLLKMRQISSASLNKIRYNCYYDDAIRLCEENADLFEEICDLNDFKALDIAQDPNHYNPKDIIHQVHLFREHGYSWTYGDKGVTLIRKNAEPDWKQTMKALASNVRSQIARNITPYDMKPFERLAMQHADDSFTQRILQETRKEYLLYLEIEKLKSKDKPQIAYGQLQLPGLEGEN